ncbi:MAG: PilZ domain-containing protein [Candidatus Eremiobacteraeota bacterium]|nr:PilZ domain-containing protein [Candidatus Eremiobacteraeota bacterium]
MPTGVIALFDSVKRFLARRPPDRYSRRWPRIAIAEPAQVRLPNGDDKPVIVNQLSVGGARIQSTQPLKAGENIELQFDGIAGQRQSVAARIVYSLKENPGYYFACGLCFLGLRPHETQWLAAYIAAQQTRRRALAAETAEPIEATGSAQPAES